MAVIEVEESVQKLNPKELEEFRAWFYEFDQENWDEQLKNDIKNGKLDAISQKAINDYKSGKFKKI